MLGYRWRDVRTWQSELGDKSKWVRPRFNAPKPRCPDSSKGAGDFKIDARLFVLIVCKHNRC